MTWLCVLCSSFRVTLFPRMLTDLNLERSTWQLIHALYQDRVESESQEDMVVELLVCVCVCLYVCMCVCAHVSVCVCVCAHACVCQLKAALAVFLPSLLKVGVY